jgi:hypothetical protein
LSERASSTAEEPSHTHRGCIRGRSIAQEEQASEAYLRHRGCCQGLGTPEGCQAAEDAGRPCLSLALAGTHPCEGLQCGHQLPSWALVGIKALKVYGSSCELHSFLHMTRSGTHLTCAHAHEFFQVSIRRLTIGALSLPPAVNNACNKVRNEATRAGHC